MHDDAADAALARSDWHADHESLAEELAALAYPVRLQLLEILRTPRLASEIRLSPRRVAPGENPDRPAAKPTVQAHLDRLVQSEFVRVEDVGTGARKAFRYSVNAQRLYALVEDLRRLGLLYAGQGARDDETGTVPAAGGAPSTMGPRLVVVHGAYEGKAFPLSATLADARWVIGRRAEADICLDYDGFVSAENAAVTALDGAHVLQDLGSKNGTSVNWRRLGRSERHPLRSGDVVGVGRSLLVYVAG